MQKHSQKPPVQFSQLSTLLLQQGCSTTTSGNYLWFDVTTTLCYPFYFLEFVPNTSQVHTLFSIHPSRRHKPLKHLVDNLQSPHETLRNHQSHSNNPHAPHALICHYSNKPFTGWTGQRHLNVISGSCSPNVDYEMLLLCSGV